jgi:hypothetical protein
VTEPVDRVFAADKGEARRLAWVLARRRATRLADKGDEPLAARIVEDGASDWPTFARSLMPPCLPSRNSTPTEASDPMEAAYIGVHLWAQAVKSAGSDDVHAIRQAINDQRFNAPEGQVSIDPPTHHLSKFIRIGRITGHGRFEVVYCSDAPISPLPYPATRSKGDWDALLTDMHLLWGGQWAAPAP